MELCGKNGFRYILTHKGSRQRNLYESYQLFVEGGCAEIVEGIVEEKVKAGYVNHIEETVEKENTANIFEYSYLAAMDNGKIKNIKFQWITDNLEEMIKATRGRWKIENEGFNNQKNGIYEIEHLNSRDRNAMKIVICLPR